MTYEEISTNFPIGKIYDTSKKVIRHTHVWYSEADLMCYKRTYDEVQVLGPNFCECVKTIVTNHIVEGWLFDGKEWYVAEDTWDGWIPIDMTEYTKGEIE